MKTLIVSEKNIAAKRIAEMLSKGKNSTTKGAIPTYKFQLNGDDVTCIGLKGHILKVDFPDKYSNWQDPPPEELINAEIIKIPTQKNLVTALKREAKGVDKVIVATDFDREGELIGVDALNEIKKVNENIEIKRARFSALTKKELEDAFSNLEEPYYSLAMAGEARQDIDLIWGATLTRFMSLASTRLGSQFLSVGRVQSPTLALIVEREHERKAFVSEPYWQLKGTFKIGSDEFEASHKTEKFWKKDEIDEAFSKLGDSGKVTKIKKAERASAPPAPFNTTSFMTSAAATGVSPANAMRIAESLYMEGYTSYPRVDNTVYPESLDFREILSSLESVKIVGSLAKEIGKTDKFEPTRGKKQATDHPPIHPTGANPGDKLDDQHWKIYEMITRRFMATLATEATIASIRVDIEAGNEPFFTRGSQVVTPGWLHYYPYGKKKDIYLPDLNEGDKLELTKKIVEDKETQPPGRYSQGSLIQKMEDLELGTKATRHNIIQNLYYRGYTHSDPIVPTNLGIAMADSLKKHAEKISSPSMTADLEADMDQIVDGKTDRDKVVDRSRKMLDEIFKDLIANKEEVGTEIRAGIQEGNILGKCPNSEGDLRIIRSKKTRKRFVGCSDYPECKTTFPLPQNGTIIPLGETCEHCGSPKIKVITKGRRPWELCVDPDCSTKDEYKKKKAAKK